MKKFGEYKYYPHNYLKKSKAAPFIKSVSGNQSTSNFANQTTEPKPFSVGGESLEVDRPLEKVLAETKQKEPETQTPYNCYLKFLTTHDKIAKNNKRR